MYTYGISLDTYNDKLKAQNNVCAICNNPEINGNKLSIDHNHITDKVRGLLCNNCNLMLGKAKDNAIILQLAVDYLIKHDKLNKPTYKELEEENKLLKEKLNGTDRIHQDKT